MSNAGAQAHAFYDEVAQRGMVYSVAFDDEQGGHPRWPCDIDPRDRTVAPTIRNESFTRPVWSSRSRVERLLKGPLGGDEPLRIVEWDWETFVRDIARPIEKEGGRLGVNWSGSRMTGFNLEVQWVVEAVEKRRRSEPHQP